MARADCPECGGTGWKTVESRNAGGSAVREAVLCGCTREGQEDSLYERARIPKRYRHCDFTGFATDCYFGPSPTGDWCRSLNDAKTRVESFVANFSRGTGNGFLLIGPCGVGKTHLAVAALVELIKRGHEGLFYDYRDLLREIQLAYESASHSNDPDVVEATIGVELLVLDDLGSAQPSPWTLDKLGYVLNRRYEEKRTTLLTTCYQDNRQPVSVPVLGGETLSHLQDVLIDRVGYRVRSRLYEMCQTIEITAPDYRASMPCDTSEGAGSISAGVAGMREQRELSAVEQARIPKRYRRCDFDSFDTDIQYEGPEAEAWNQSLRRARLIVTGFAREFPECREHGLLLMGPNGVGKTHLAVAGLIEILNRGHGALFYDYRDLLKEIQSSYSGTSEFHEMEVLEPVLTAEVLLLDDFGGSKPSAWVLDTVGYLLNTRYNENRATILTTSFLDREEVNQPPMITGQTPRNVPDSLTDRVGARIRSCLYEMCRAVEIIAPDYRKKVRNAGPYRA